MTNVYVQSGYPRIKNDNYRTVDPRCTDAFLKVFTPQGWIVDVCAPDGSGIVDRCVERGIVARGVDDALGDTLFSENGEDWIVSNPPYKRDIVDTIIYFQINRLREHKVRGVAMLLRANFDFAKSRIPMFRDNPLYRGQIKMLFRPIWIEGEQRAQPIHNFVWHIWERGDFVGGWNQKTIWYVE